MHIVINVLLIDLFKLCWLYQRNLLGNNFMIRFSYYLGIIAEYFLGISQCKIARIQRRIQNPVKYPRWIFSQKYLTIFIHYVLLRKAPYKTAQKMKFSIKDFSSKCDQIRSFLRIWSHLLETSLIENFIFCAV